MGGGGSRSRTKGIGALHLTNNLDEVVAEVRRVYGLSGPVRIERRPPVPVFEGTHGSVSGTEDGWLIELVGVGSYVCFHELMHAVLMERGCAPPSKYPDSIGKFLGFAKNLVDDHLIETEVCRQWGRQYQRTYAGSRLDSTSVSDRLEIGAVEKMAVAIFFDLVSIATVCRHVYPALASRPVPSVMLKLVRSPRIDAVLDITADLTFASIDPPRYRAALEAVIRALVDAPCTVTAECVLADELPFATFAADVAGMFQGIRAGRGGDASSGS